MGKATAKITKSKATARIKKLQMARLEAEADGFGLSIVKNPVKKPWGGYLLFSNSSLPDFLDAYWSGARPTLPKSKNSVAPKVLLIAPNAAQGKPAKLDMLSLQWHSRRRELWRVIDGPVLFFSGTSWKNLRGHIKETGDVIKIGKGEWHCLIGLANWGRVAELWVHSDPENPSVEQDIEREYDKYWRDKKRQNTDYQATAKDREKKWREAYNRWWSRVKRKPAHLSTRI